MQGDNLWLIIQTNKYTGNFDRELLAYVFGLYDEKTALGEEIIDEELFSYENFVDNNPDYGEEISEKYDNLRLGRCDPEYHGTFIAPAPSEHEECNSIFIALKDKLSERTLGLMMRRLCEFASKRKITILSVNHYQQVYVLA